ncbi:hypothetical protein PR048_001253 [Dryococelus australis]|uniref:Uncharacterized protein n=1 Tax=Dryococelus australis TaxID=614101 RepID=A0ABQ9IJ87_9NEOP|nr:hypothetical protein PR048_001253 [Dryococelus australis]
MSGEWRRIAETKLFRERNRKRVSGKTWSKFGNKVKMGFAKRGAASAQSEGGRRVNFIGSIRTEVQWEEEEEIRLSISRTLSQLEPGLIKGDEKYFTCVTSVTQTQGVALRFPYKALLPRHIPTLSRIIWLRDKLEASHLRSHFRFQAPVDNNFSDNNSHVGNVRILPWRRWFSQGTFSTSRKFILPSIPTPLIQSSGWPKQRSGDYGADPDFKGGGKREIPEKTRQPAASSATIPTWGNLGATPPEIEPVSLRCGASILATTPPRPPETAKGKRRSSFDSRGRVAHKEQEVVYFPTRSAVSKPSSSRRRQIATLISLHFVLASRPASSRQAEMGDPRENTPISVIVRHAFHMKAANGIFVWYHTATVGERLSRTHPPPPQYSELGSIPVRIAGFSQVVNVPDDAVGRRVFSGISRSPRPFIPHWPDRFSIFRRDCHLAEELRMRHGATVTPPTPLQSGMELCVQGQEARERAIRATLTRTPSASSLLRASGARVGEVGITRENQPTNGIIWHDLQMRKPGSGPSRNRTRFPRWEGLAFRGQSSGSDIGFIDIWYAKSRHEIQVRSRSRLSAILGTIFDAGDLDLDPVTLNDH